MLSVPHRTQRPLLWFAQSRFLFIDIVWILDSVQFETVDERSFYGAVGLDVG